MSSRPRRRKRRTWNTREQIRKGALTAFEADIPQADMTAALAAQIVRKDPRYVLRAVEMRVARDIKTKVNALTRERCDSAQALASLFPDQVKGSPLCGTGLDTLRTHADAMRAMTDSFARTCERREHALTLLERTGAGTFGQAVESLELTEGRETA